MADHDVPAIVDYVLNVTGELIIRDLISRNMEIISARFGTFR